MEERAAKYCGKCGAELETDMRFCPVCGCPVKPQGEPEQPVQQEEPVWKTEPVQQEEPIWKEAPVQQEEPVWKEAPIQQEEPGWKEEPAPAPKKSRVKKASGSRWVRTTIIIAAVVLLLAAAATAAGIYLGVLGGPLQRMKTAIGRTARAGSLTVDMPVMDMSVSTSDVVGYISVYAQFDRDPVIWMTGTDTSGETPLRVALRDGYLAYCVEGSYGSVDARKEIHTLLNEAYNLSSDQSSEQMDWEELLESLKHDAYEKLSKSIDMEQAEKDMRKLARNMNSKKWMEKNAGYSCKWKDGELTHTLHIDPYVFMMACLECFEDSFYSRSDYYDLQNTIKDTFSDAGRIDLTLSVRNGKVSAFTFGFDTVAVSGTLRGVGSTVIDEQKVRAFCDKARNS